MTTNPPPQARRGTPRVVLAQIVVCLATATVLGAGELQEAAERMPFGPRRDLALVAVEPLVDVTDAWELDRPAAAVRQLAGRDSVGPSVQPRLGSRPAATPTGSTELAIGHGPPLGEPSLGLQSWSALTVVPSTPGLSTEDVPFPTAPLSTVPFPTVLPPIAGPEGAGGTPSGTGASAGGPEPRPVGPQDKLRVWAGGDSLGEYVGSVLSSPLADPNVVSVELDYHISTGLARPDYFDWPARIGDVAQRLAPPDAIVYMVGGNDNQNMLVGDDIVQTGAEEWYAEYGARITAIADSIDPTRTQMFWIGLPPMRDAARHDLAEGMNDIARTVADGRPHVTFIDIEEMFSGPDGGYVAHIDDPTGARRQARATDGVHITLAGSSWVAEIVWAEIADRWQLRPTSSTWPEPTTDAVPL